MKSIEILIPIYVCDPSLYPVIQSCIDSLEEHYPQIPRILIDDASPLPIPKSWGITLRNDENMGYTATVNRLLQASKADIIIVANDDLHFKAGDLDRFRDLDGLVIASPRDTASSPDDRFGSIFGMTRETLQKLGYLNESYKHFWSDLDYYNRAKDAGVTIIKWNDILIDHPESSTFKTLNKEELLAIDTAEWERNTL